MSAVFDAYSFVNFDWAAGSPKIRSVSHACTGTNRYLIADVYIDRNVVPDSVTYNGVAMTDLGFVKTVSTGARIRRYQLINPDSGAHNIVVQVPSDCKIAIGGDSFTNVDQTTPAGTSVAADKGWGAGVFTNTVSSETGGIVLDSCLAYNGGSENPTPGGGQTQTYDGGVANGSYKDGAASVSTTWTNSGLWEATGISTPIKSASTIMVFAEEIEEEY